jgi:hypothetical protein
MNRTVKILGLAPGLVAWAAGSFFVVSSYAGCVTSPAGLVSWWPAEGNVQDIAGANPGTLPGGSLAYTGGEVGQAFSFDGVSNYIHMPASPTLDVGSGSGLTLECWLKPADLTAGHALAEWNDGAGHIGATVWISIPALGGPGSVFVDLVDSTAGDHIFASAPNLLTTMALQHLAITYDKTTGAANIFYNGAVVAAQNLGIFTPQTTYSLDLGTRSSGNGTGQFYKGLLDEVALYNRALSATEVSAIFTAGSAGKCSPSSPPGIYAEPSGLTVTVGDSAAFSVGAGGTPPMVYQWSYNGSNIDGATATSLVLTNVQVAQAGIYAVAISNAFGVTNSSDATLTVNPAPVCVGVPLGLVGWWRAEGSADDWLGQNSATVQGAVTFGPGIVGQAFSLTGTSAAIVVAKNPYLNVGSGQGLTIETWIQPASATTMMPVVEWNADQGYNPYGVHFWISVGGGPGCLFANLVDSAGNYHVIQTGPGLLTATAFQHVALTYDKPSGQAKLYLNGQVVATQNLGSFTAQTSYDCYFGQRPAGTPASQYAGWIDEVSIYGRGLADAEIQAIFGAGKAGKCAQPVAPFINSQPASQSVVVGATASFTALASGTAPLSYQWAKSGSNIDGATASTLTLTNAQFSDAGTYAVTVTNSAGPIASSNATLTVTFPPALVQAASVSGQGGGTVVVPVSLVANGNENALGFSLGFDANKLAYLDARLGSSAASATLLVNTNLVGSGKLGLLLGLPTGAALPAGTQELVQVSFALAPFTNRVATPVPFGDVPTARQLADTNAVVVAATYAGGSVSIAPASFEGDLSPRPNGDEAVTAADWVLVGRYVARLDYPTNGSEFQRADCAPRSTLGDGYLLVNDWVQAGRYAAGLDPMTVAGGPTTEGPLAMASRKIRLHPGSGTSLVSAGSLVLAEGQAGAVPVTLAAQGTENALGFSLTFDPTLLTYVGTSPGADATGATLLVNSSQAASGHVGYALALGTGNTFASGNRELIRASFRASSSGTGIVSAAFGDQPVPRSISDASANVVPGSYTNGTISVDLPPSLTIGLSGQSILLSWPLWASNFTLQEAQGPLPISGSWTNPPVSVGISNGQSEVNLPLGPTAKYYRLSHP